jgi:hypothetical protein
MDLNRNVIIDLLPLYLADEASPETQTLVKEYLDHDSDLAQLARRWKERLPDSPPEPVSPDAQAVAYQQAKRQITNRVITLATIIAIGGLALITMAMIGAMFVIGL